MIRASVAAPRSNDDDGFRTPAWTEDVSLEQYIAACPPDAMTRGTFFQHPCDLVTREMGEVPDALYDGLARRRWLAFQKYPVREFLTLAHNAAKVAYPEAPRTEGLRRVGRTAYPSFAATMAGRVTLFAFGDRLEDVLRASPKAYAIALPGVTVRAIDRGPRHWRFEMRDVHSFVDSYHYGVLEGAVEAFDRVPEIRIRRFDNLLDADFDVRWT